MPRVNLGKSIKKDPPIDWIKAAVLERMDAKEMTMKDLAAASGIGYANMRVLMDRSPALWKPDYLNRVCAVLGIETVLHVVGAPQIGGPPA